MYSYHRKIENLTLFPNYFLHTSKPTLILSYDTLCVVYSNILVFYKNHHLRLVFHIAISPNIS